MKVDLAKPGTPNELVHHGVKGMHWGVRNTYISRTERRAAQHRRVAEGKGSFKDKVKTHATTSNLQLSRHGGFKRAALARAVSAENHARRMKDGEATTKDMLRFIGTVRTTDMLPRR